MMFDPSAYIPQAELNELLSNISVSLRAGGNSFLLGIAAYVLLAIGLYAIAKRSVIIIAGDRPSCNNTFELMNVVPQIADVAIAMM